MSSEIGTLRLNSLGTSGLETVGTEERSLHYATLAVRTKRNRRVPPFGMTLLQRRWSYPVYDETMSRRTRDWRRNLRAPRYLPVAAIPASQEVNDSGEVEEAETREAEFLEEPFLEELFFNQGELCCLHFAAVGGKGAVHFTTEAK